MTNRLPTESMGSIVCDSNTVQSAPPGLGDDVADPAVDANRRGAMFQGYHGFEARTRAGRSRSKRTFGSRRCSETETSDGVVSACS